MQDKKRRNRRNEGGSVFFVVGTFDEGVKKAEKSKLRNGRPGFLWKEKDKKDVSVWELKTFHQNVGTVSQNVGTQSHNVGTLSHNHGNNPYRKMSVPKLRNLSQNVETPSRN